MDAATLSRQRRALSDRLTNGLRDVFTGLDAWRDADAARFAAYADPTVRGTQTSLAGLVSSYLAADAATDGDILPPPVIPASRVTNLRGVDGRSVYTRPFVELWHALSQGKTLQKAIDLGSNRLVEIAELDLQAAHSHALREGMRRLRRTPRLYRRVLMGDSSCALCVLASTHRYTIEDLNPIHAHCDCEVAGIYDADTTRVDDDAALEQVHAAVRDLLGTDADRGGRRVVDYRQIQISREHGELGPMLARPSDKFTSVDDLPAVSYTARQRRRTRT